MTRAVFITGGSRGIGRGLVLAFVQAGHPVAFTYQSQEQAAQETLSLARTLHSEARINAYKMDVRDNESIEQIVEQSISEFEDFGVIINNAGIVKPMALAIAEPEDLREEIETNLIGPTLVTRAFLPHLLSMRKGGRIISVSSITHNGASGQAAYAASKAGLIALMKSVGKEYGKKEITANVIAPGLIKTEMTQDLSSKVISFWKEFCPAGRVGTVEDVASAALFLASSGASFINGEVIHVSGGLNFVP